MKRVLIVDDDITTAQLIERFMEDDFVSDIALSGVEAMNHLSATNYDLVISDVRMPNGSGIDVLRALQGHARKVPIILISAETEGAKLQAKALGADAFLLKPLTRECLKEALARLVYLTSPAAH